MNKASKQLALKISSATIRVFNFFFFVKKFSGFYRILIFTLDCLLQTFDLLIQMKFLSLKCYRLILELFINLLYYVNLARNCCFAL